MSVYKLTLELEQETCHLLGIFSSLPIDTLSYFLNKHTDLLLRFSKEPLLIVRQQDILKFNVCFFEDTTEHIKYHLFENQITSIDKINQNNLFLNQTIQSTHYFFEQYKNINYFLKIYGDESVSIAKKLELKLNQISVINSTVNLPLSHLKNINDLIFD